MPNKRAPGTVVTSVSLPRDLLDRVRARAKREGENVSHVIRRALENYAPEEK